MKKGIIVVLFLSSIQLSSQVVNILSRKSFEKATNVISIGGDLGIYDYVSKVGSSATSNTNRAGNKMLNLQYERGIKNWLGIGVKLQVSDYFTSKDSITNTKPTVRAVDGLVIVNLHVVRVKRLNLLVGTNIGYSSLNWEARDQYISKAAGGGLTYDFHIQPRFYFQKHFGMFLNLAYVHYDYQNMDFTNLNTKISDVLDLTGGGANFGIGFQFKL